MKVYKYVFNDTIIQNDFTVIIISCLAPVSWDEYLYIKGDYHSHIMIDYEKTLDIIFGRWKSQTLYAGVKLGVFYCVTSDPKKTSDIAKQLNLDLV